MIDLFKNLQHILAERPPGPRAMQPWTPQLAYGRHFGPLPPGVRQAAVAVLLYPHAGEWFLPLTLRPGTLTHHAGQVSLPGGSINAGETPEEGAWRELAEELGIPRDTFQPIGRLTPLYIFVSNFYVVPCVALAERLPQFVPNPSEVEALIEFPLDRLLRLSPESMWIERGGLRFRAPCWTLGAQRIWGASAMILGELAAAWALAGE
jgi:8-oxo-dGTP pyrophosphatase MutT (NUDIX family)